MAERRIVDEAALRRTVAQLVDDNRARVDAFTRHPGATIRGDDLIELSLPPAGARPAPPSGGRASDRPPSGGRASDRPPQPPGRPSERPPQPPGRPSERPPPPPRRASDRPPPAGSGRQSKRPPPPPAARASDRPPVPGPRPSDRPPRVQAAGVRLPGNPVPKVAGPAPGPVPGAAAPEPPSSPALRRPPAGASALELGETLGEGGMGVVRQAVQRSLERPVAVKSLQSHFQNDQAVAMMLQEAYIMSHLEHPNILPVYDLQWDERALPRLVLKKVEGTEWKELMGDAHAVRERFGEHDLLEWNLRVLMQVCNAVHFAHSRGIIHRDLKPENVMIGAFGEVYVMDWGLALSLRDDGSGRLPLASKADQLAGTPHYMAPEMTGGQAHLMSERTDVYLLGAMLFQVVAGEAPHQGSSMEQLLSSVLRSNPSFPTEAPEELVRICREAMDRDPGWRHESAESLRLSINRFLQHRGSHRLVAQANRIYARLKGQLSAEPPEDATLAQERALRIHDHFGEVRFAYRQALEIWPDNDVAAQGLQAAVLAMIDYELQRDTPHSAALLVSALEAPEADLLARIEASVSAKDRHTRALQDLGKQLDPGTRRKDRAIGAAILGALWTIAPMLLPGVIGADESSGATHLGAMGVIGGATVLLVGWMVIGREELVQSAISRRLLSGAMVAMLGVFAVEAAGALLSLSIEYTQVLWFAVFFCVTAMLSVAVEKLMAPTAVGFLIGLLVAARYPGERFVVMTGTNLLLTVNLLGAWLPRRRGLSAAPRGPKT